MDVFRNRSSFLLTQFREFYREVARLKRSLEYAASPAVPESALALAAGAASSATAVATVARPASGSAGAASGVWQPLVSLLERQGLEAGEMGGSFAYEVYREAQYVMCALADEIFLHLDWEGRDDWPLLESRFFQTRFAGEELFNRLDRLLQRNDPFYVDLASVYFMALSLGFQGQYRGVQSNRLAMYRQQLFTMIYRRNPKLFTTGGQLFPQAYQNVMENVAVKKLPSTWMGLWLIVGVLVVWMAASQYTWSSATASISCLMCNLLGRGCVCDIGPQTSGAPAAKPAPGAAK